MPLFDKFLYIDYENVQDFNVNVIEKSMKVIIIVGQDQVKMPFDLIKKTQPYGEAVEWIQVDGKGRNALDFFIAYFLGRDVSQGKGKIFIIYSKDTGYDPLINSLRTRGIKVKRIVSYQELILNNSIKMDEDKIKKVEESLLKLAANKRPKKRKTLIGFITNLLNGTPKQEIEKTIEGVFIKKIAFEENGLIKYALKK
jgi:hypothetical protein